MPYIVCPGCNTRSYIVSRAPRSEPCPVCETPLAGDRPSACASDRGRPDDDTALVQRHRDGDPRAFGLLHDRYALELRAHACRLIGSSQTDDVVQDTFERAHHLLLADARAQEARFVLRAWLHRVLHNRCIDELRRPHAPVRLEEEVAAAGAAQPFELLAAREELFRVTSAVRALPERQRRALVLHAVDGRSHEEIATQMAVSVAATKSLVNRARVELRHNTAA